MSEEKSEFGKGLVYCIGLFLEHAGRANADKENYTKMGLSNWPETWFNASSDHLYEINTASIEEEQLKKDIEDWSKKALHWGHGFTEPKAKEEDVWWSIKQAKLFLQQIDEKILGIKIVKGEWE